MPRLANTSTDAAIAPEDDCGLVMPDELAWEGEQTRPAESPSPNNLLNDLTGREWIAETKSVWFQKGLGAKHPHAQIERQHPAPYSYQDILRLIRFFTKADGRVLDPFLGVASTLKACALSGRRGVGIELVPHWVELGRRRLLEEVGEDAASTQEIIEGDARRVLDDAIRFTDNSFDFMVCSPPYWAILNKKADHKVRNERVANGLATAYSADLDDLGNIEDYGDFLAEVSGVFHRCWRVLKPGKYACIVVSDFRHRSRYIAYHADLIEHLTREEYGGRFELQGITILAQNHKKLYPYGYPFAYVPNLHHQYIVILRKPRSSEANVAGSVKLRKHEARAQKGNGRNGAH
jgi:DNA modification methylase